MLDKIDNKSDHNQISLIRCYLHFKKSGAHIPIASSIHVILVQLKRRTNVYFHKNELLDVGYIFYTSPLTTYYDLI